MYTWEIMDSRVPRTETHGEAATAHLIERALAGGFGRETDAVTFSVTLTKGGRTIKITPEVEPTWTRRQREAVLAIAANPSEPVLWQRSRRNVSHLEFGGTGQKLSHALSLSLLDAGLVTGTGHPGTEAHLTLRARLLILSRAVSYATAVQVRTEPVPETADPEPVPAPCLFCQPGDESLNRVMMWNETCYARYDNYPVAGGHVQIVPKRHVESFFDLEPREVADAYALLGQVREYLDSTLAPDGYTIGVNEGEAAGRTVGHCHIHLIPRHYGDVKDPRGGVRKILPGPSPDTWLGK